ncbi:hypothetical protein CLOM_g21733 [Closterium sp. NIES-68]|nr:hypothetical protein CLOM_g21733 [Closterium sp. NIES-68]GJP60876.1 hypothetical protein CLOP_g18090 [Closterium sp. NIES-67]
MHNDRDPSNEDRFFTQRRTVLAFLDFLRTASLPPTVDSDALEVAADCLSEAFGVSPQNPDDLEKFSILPGTLLQLIQDSTPGSLIGHGPSTVAARPDGQPGEMSRAAPPPEPMDEGNKDDTGPRATGSADRPGEGSVAAAGADSSSGSGAETGAGEDVAMKEAADGPAEAEKPGTAGEGETTQGMDAASVDGEETKRGEAEERGGEAEKRGREEAENKEEDGGEAVDLDQKLQEFLEGLESANYYAGTEAGSEAYLERRRQATAIFHQCVQQQSEQQQEQKEQEREQKEEEDGKDRKESKGKAKEQEGQDVSAAATADAAAAVGVGSGSSSAGTTSAAGAAASGGAAATETAGSGAAAVVTEEDRKRADELKAQGNAAMSAKQYEEALTLYSKAISLCGGTNAIYYANRAAAQHQLGNYMAAAEDSKRAIAVDPSYSKAYSRLGHAYKALGRHHEAIEEGFKKALQLDPSNATHKENLKAAKRRLDEQRRSSCCSHHDHGHQHYHDAHPQHHHHAPPPPFAFPTGIPFGGFPMPGMGMPGVGIPGMGMPGAGVPGMGMPGAGVPGMGIPGMGMPGADMPGGAAPSASQTFTPGSAPGQATYNISLDNLPLDPSSISGVLGAIQNLVGGFNVAQQPQQPQQQPPPA